MAEINLFSHGIPGTFLREIRLRELLPRFGEVAVGGFISARNMSDQQTTNACPARYTGSLTRGGME
jgi:hypothetical protein